MHRCFSCNCVNYITKLCLLFAEEKNALDRFDGSDTDESDRQIRSFNILAVQF